MKDQTVKSDAGWKLLKIISTRIEKAPVLLEFSKFDSQEEQTTVLKELELLVRKIKILNVKAGERVPILSQQPEHKWFITKDRFGVQYFIYIQTFFDEKIVFKVQTKITRLLESFYDNINEGNKVALEKFRQRSMEYLEQYNSQIIRTGRSDLFLSAQNSAVEIVHVDPKPIDLAQPSEDVVVSSSDQNDIFYQMEKRQSRLKFVQCLTIFAILLALGLGALDLLQQLDRLNGGGAK
jgi:hypothetical protein